MKTVALLTFCSIALLSTPAVAEPQVPFPASRLRDACRHYIDNANGVDANVTRAVECASYIRGVVDGGELAAMSAGAPPTYKQHMPWCLPQGVSIDQLVRVVYKDLNDRPAELHVRDDFFVFRTLTATFPCKAAPSAR